MKNMKKFVALVIVFCTVLSFTCIVSASAHTNTTLSTRNGSLTYNSNVSETVHAGSHTARIKLTSVSFFGNLPVNTFPSGSSITLYMQNTGVSKTYSRYDTLAKQSSYSVDNDVTAYMGISSNNNMGVSVGCDWNPNY